MSKNKKFLRQTGAWIMTIVMAFSMFALAPLDVEARPAAQDLQAHAITMAAPENAFTALSASTATLNSVRGTATTAPFTVSVPGQTPVAPPLDVAPNTRVTLHAALPANQGLVSWSVPGVTLLNPNTLTPSFDMPASDVNITATFAQSRTLTTQVNAPAMGSVTVDALPANPPPSGAQRSVAQGTTVSVSATPTAGHRFVRWEAVGTAVAFANANTPATTFPMPSANVTVRAVFEAVGQTVTVTAGLAGGTVTASAPNVAAGTSITVAQGQTVSLAATPPAGHALSNWEVTGTPPSGFTNASITNRFSPSASFTMPAGAVSVRANFAPGRQITVTSNSAAMGTAVPSTGAAANGATVTLTATPTTGHRFVRWENVTAAGSAAVAFANVNNMVTTFTMPNAGATVRAVFEPTGQVVTVTTGHPGGITGGTAVASAPNVTAGTSISVAQGQSVTLTASNIPAGHALASWELLGTPPSGFTNAHITNRFSPTATFTMPTGAVSVRANFAAGSQVNVTANNNAMGVAVPNSGAATNGATVTLTATPAAGHRFVRWEVPAGTGNPAVAFVNAYNATTSFTMPNYNVNIRAVFEAGHAVTAGGGVNINYTLAAGTVSLDLNPQVVTSILNAATGGAAVIDMTGVANATAVTVPTTAITTISNANVGLTFRMPGGTLAMNNSAARSVAFNAVGTNVSAALNTVSRATLPAVQQNAVALAETVYNINITSGGHHIRTFEGTLTITLPYTGPLPVAVWRLGANGERIRADNISHNAAARTVSFTTNQLSLFVLGQDVASHNPFADVPESAWFRNYALYVFSRSIMGATSENPMRFSPDMPLSRAMIVTILWRNEGSPNTAGLQNPFNDVPSGQWFSEAILWAANVGVVSGFPDGSFAPNNNVSRQDLALILMNYASFANISLPSTRPYQPFNDEAAIGSWAAPAVRRSFEAGIIGGLPGNVFNPSGPSSRAEAAAMLQRFLEAANR